MLQCLLKACRQQRMGRTQRKYVTLMFGDGIHDSMCLTLTSAELDTAAELRATQWCLAATMARQVICELYGVPGA